jgi:hypothetical protein
VEEERRQREGGERIREIRGGHDIIKERGGRRERGGREEKEEEEKRRERGGRGEKEEEMKIRKRKERRGGHDIIKAHNIPRLFSCWGWTWRGWG